MECGGTDTALPGACDQAPGSQSAGVAAALQRAGRVRRAAAAMLAGLLAGCGAGSLPPAPPAALEQITPEAFAAHVGVLADPNLGGRMTGTPEHDRAGEYIVRQFDAAGLKPAGDDGGWYQPFPAANLRVPAKGCFLSYRRADGPSGPARAMLHAEFSAMASGTSGAFRGPLVFAGYGVHNRIRGYDDYASVSAAGAVAMVLQGEPHDRAGRSRWGVGTPWTRLASVDYKLHKAAEEGALAVLVVTPPDISPEHDPLCDVLGDGTGPLPAMRISRALADRLLAAGGKGRTLAELVRRIHETNQPMSLPVGVEVAGEVDLAPGAGRNVIGSLPPEQGSGGPVVVIGAHYDHIPPTGRLAKDKARGFGVRPGADDNASGVSAMVVVARALARTPGRRCTFLFVAFSGEEIGFLGSKHFAAQPTVGRDRLAAMVNIDQVGHVRNGRVMVIGRTETGPCARAVRLAAGQVPDLEVARVPFANRHGWSDQAAFALAGIPTLFFYCGRTKLYHTMDDTADRIAAPAAASVARLIYHTARALDATLLR